MFEIYKDEQGLWRFRIKALNNKIIAVSESYTSKQNCMKGIKSLINTVNNAEVKDIETGDTWRSI